MDQCSGNIEFIKVAFVLISRNHTLAHQRDPWARHWCITFFHWCPSLIAERSWAVLAFLGIFTHAVFRFCLSTKQMLQIHQNLNELVDLVNVDGSICTDIPLREELFSKSSFAGPYPASPRVRPHRPLSGPVCSFSGSIRLRRPYPAPSSHIWPSPPKKEFFFLQAAWKFAGVFGYLLAWFSGWMSMRKNTKLRGRTSHTCQIFITPLTGGF